MSKYAKRPTANMTDDGWMDGDDGDRARESWEKVATRKDGRTEGRKVFSGFVERNAATGVVTKKVRTVATCCRKRQI